MSATLLPLFAQTPRAHNNIMLTTFIKPTRPSRSPPPSLSTSNPPVLPAHPHHHFPHQTHPSVPLTPTITFHIKPTRPSRPRPPSLSTSNSPVLPAHAHHHFPPLASGPLFVALDVSGALRRTSSYAQQGHVPSLAQRARAMQHARLD
jgi:hypothetical protein